MTPPSTTPMPPATTPAAPPGTPPGVGRVLAQPSDTGDTGDWMGEAISGAIESIFRGMIDQVVGPLLDLLSSSLLSTPQPSQLPELVGLWEGSRALALSLYGLLVAVGALVVMTYQTLQSHYTLREIGPRIVLGFFAAVFSLAIADQATVTANALARAVLGDAVNPDAAAAALRQMLTDATNGTGGLWLVVVGLSLPVLLVILLITDVVCAVLAAILLIAAPLALVFHALPQTEGLARWLWRAYACVLAVPIAQALALSVGLRVILTPSGLVLTDNPGQPWIGVLVLIALLGIMIKIPFWLLSRVGAGGPSIIRMATRAVFTYHALRYLGRVGGRAGWRGGWRRIWRPGPGHRPDGSAGPGPGRGPGGRRGPLGPLGSPVRPRPGPRPLSGGGAAIPAGQPGAPEQNAPVPPIRHGSYPLAPRRPDVHPARPTITASTSSADAAGTGPHARSVRRGSSDVQPGTTGRVHAGQARALVRPPTRHTTPTAPSGPGGPGRPAAQRPIRPGARAVQSGEPAAPRRPAPPPARPDRPPAAPPAMQPWATRGARPRPVTRPDTHPPTRPAAGRSEHSTGHSTGHRPGHGPARAPAPIPPPARPPARGPAPVRPDRPRGSRRRSAGPAVRPSGGPSRRQQ